MRTALRTIFICVILLTLLVCTTQPHSLPQVVLIAPFILLFVSLALFVAVLLALKSKGLTVRHLRLGALAASLPILLLILQSIGQLTLRDVATTGALFVLGYFYMARRAVGQRSER